MSMEKLKEKIQKLLDIDVLPSAVGSNGYLVADDGRYSDFDPSLVAGYITTDNVDTLYLPFKPGYDSVGSIIDEIETLACEELILPNGQPNTPPMFELKRHFEGKVWVGPGETDSSGWLTGVIHTPHGQIVYG